MVKSSKSSPVTSHQDSCSCAGGHALPRFHVPAKTLSSTLSSFPHLTKFQSLIWWALKELHIDQRASFQKLCFISGLILPPKTSNLPLRTQMLHHLSSFIFFIISYVFIWTHLLSFTQKKVSTDFPLFSLSKVQLFGTFSKMRGAAIFLRPQMLVGLNESAAGCTHGFSRCWSGSHGRICFLPKRALKGGNVKWQVGKN